MENHRAAVNGHPAGHESKKPQQYKKLLFAVGAILLVLLSAALVLMYLAGDKPKADRYQVVVLSTGQIYFGKLKNTTGSYLRLEDVYYTKAEELPANATKEQKEAVSNNSTLVKMGSEVYGPESVLKIRAEQVMFWQDLAADSKVAKAIKGQE